MRMLAIVTLTVALVWYLSAGWRRERRERRQVEWDEFIASVIADTDLSVSETPIYDELTVAQFRAELDAWGDRR